MFNTEQLVRDSLVSQGRRPLCKDYDDGDISLDQYREFQDTLFDYFGLKNREHWKGETKSLYDDILEAKLDSSGFCADWKEFVDYLKAKSEFDAEFYNLCE